MLQHAHFGDKGGKEPFAAPCTKVCCADIAPFRCDAEFAQFVGGTRHLGLGAYFRCNRVYVGNEVFDALSSRIEESYYNTACFLFWKP
jgi:hypothetical protein